MTLQRQTQQTRRYRKLDPQTFNRILARYQSGERLRAICRDEGFNEKNVRRRLRPYGLVGKPLARALLLIGDKDLTVETLAARLVDRFRSGTSVKQIAAETQISCHSVVRLLETAGVQLRFKDSVNNYSASDRERITRLYQSGCTVIEIAARTGGKPYAIRRILLDEGIAMRSHKFTSQPLTSTKGAKAVRLYQLYRNVKQVAQQLKCTSYKITRHLKQQGIDLRHNSGRKRQELSAAQRKAILRLHGEGRRVSQISRELSVSVFFVTRTVHEDLASTKFQPRRKK